MTSPDLRPCPVCATDTPSANAFCGACGARMPVSTSTAGHDALIGRVIDGRFRISRLLGTGGMGAVYLAEHVGIGKRVAIKVLRADLRDQRDLLRRFRREAMAVSKLADAHTITVFDFGVWKGLVYLVMEYLKGADLALVLDLHGRLPLDRCLRIALQICSSLAEAHELGIVHRDLKPENIFLTHTAGGAEVVKVLDFGLAKILRDEERAETFQTQKGALLGTPYFMAPEQIEGDPVDARTDLYALGALLVRMITGRYAFDGDTPVTVLERHLSGRRPALSELAPDLSIPPAVAALVGALIARAPAARPADARAVVDVLVAALRTLGERPTGPVAPQPAPQASRPSWSAPSAFSTSDPGLLDPRAATLAQPFVDSEPAVTRSELARYEARLIWRRRLRWLGLVVGIGGALAGAAWYLALREEPPPQIEHEPNDEPAVATRLAEGVVMRGYLGRRQQRDRSDRDVFAVELPESGASVSLRLTAVPDIDLVLEGYDDAGERLFQRNARGRGLGEDLSGQWVGAPRLFVVVREVWVEGQPPSENSTDAYTLEAEIERAP